MATWMSIDQYSRGLEEDTKDSQRAPNPAGYSVSTRPGRGTSYWIGEHPIALDKEWRNAELPSRRADVVIIGSGITGAAAAYRLAELQPDLKVAVFEARGLCTGATGRNGGHIGRPEAYHLRQLAQIVGTEDAIRCRQLILKNRDLMLAAIDKLGVADKVDLCLDGEISVFSSAEERENYEKDLDFGRQHGLEPECYLLTADEVMKKINISSSRTRFGAAFLGKSGTIYPRKLVDALLRHATQTMPNLTLHPHTSVSSVSYDRDTQIYSVETSKGLIQSRSVFHATNGYANHLLPVLRGAEGVLGCKCHCIAAKPDASGQAQLKEGFGYDDFWHWIVQRPDAGPLVYGWSGVEEAFHDFDDSITIPADHPGIGSMLEFLRETFPQSFKAPDYANNVIYDWTGVMGMTKTGASVVGRPMKASPGEFMSVGHNGEGMTRCFACAVAAIDGLLDYLAGHPRQDWTPPDWLPKCYRRNI